MLKIKDYQIESTKHKAPLGATRELVTGGESELFFVGNETHEASVGVGATCELVFVAGRESRGARLRKVKRMKLQLVLYVNLSLLLVMNRVKMK